MNKREKTILNLCLIYFIYVFMYGIVVKFTISNTVLFQVKTIIPEIILILIIIECVILNGVCLKKTTFFLLLYSLFVLLVNFLIYNVNEQAKYLIRDIYIPLVLFAFLSSIKFSEENIVHFISKIINFGKFYLVIGLILAIVEQIKGWEWSSAFYTGYSFYGQDPVSKVKIAHNFGLLRAPSLSGNFATFGYYCLILIILITSQEKKAWKRVFWDLIAFMCMLLATNKSAIVAFGVIVILNNTIDLRRKSPKANGVIIAMLIGIVGIVAVFLLGDNSDGTSLATGVLMRFDVWKDIFNEISWKEVLFPYKQFTYGSGSEGNFSFWDNTYLYFLFSQGIVGTVLWINMLRNAYQSHMNNDKVLTKYYVYNLTIVLLVLSLTVNVTQGRGFLSFYLILIAIRCYYEEESIKNQMK